MSDMPIGLEENTTIDGARIKVIGVGGGGNNAVDGIRKRRTCYKCKRQG